MSYQDPRFEKPLFTLECPACGGAGYFLDENGEQGDTCDKCDGHGQVEDDSEPEFDKYEND